MSGEALSEADREALKVCPDCGSDPWSHNDLGRTLKKATCSRTVIQAREAAVEAVLAAHTADLTARLAAVEAERDSAQEHMAYHLRDFRPVADMAATGDLAVDMAHYADRLRARLAKVEAVHLMRTISVRGGIVLDYRDICAGCSAIDEDGGVHYWVAWPCPTRAALTGALDWSAPSPASREEA